MSALPLPRTTLLAAALSCTLVATVARADGISCRECAPLPADYTLEPQSCETPTPLVFGKPSKARPTSTQRGVFVDVDLTGVGAHPARIWLGVSHSTVPYYAIFQGTSKTASSCGALGGFEVLADFGTSLHWSPAPASLPYVRISSHTRLGACAGLNSVATVAWLALSKRWAVLNAYDHGDGFCAGDEPDPSVKLHAEGLKAYRSGDFTTAETLWRKALPLGKAVSDLGFMFDQRGRSKEAERWLVAAAASHSRPEAWLNLADLYWKTGHRPLAAKVYRGYIYMFNLGARPKHGKPAPTPVKRALQRASKD
ncbi:tetratricopeptide repeat protein [Archangium lansingense]|uniref:Tetratricopeptide repeat protein n=1 Tax=Archangium lansingense TaxID=2995310 RepID=A0ABT4A423_9BACT|nr:hypothetical protein [Archangium lansinium]MCY1075697.1 hypothetical protein [Archangium lansinium]